MGKKRVRAVALCILRQGDHIFVNHARDPVSGEDFYRPLGGRIKFGESSQQTIVRELMEEIGAAVEVTGCLGTLEAMFTFMGQPRHEITLICNGRFVDELLYERQRVTGHESDRPQGDFDCSWQPLSRFRSGEARLYPEGLLGLVDGGD